MKIDRTNNDFLIAGGHQQAQRPLKDSAKAAGTDQAQVSSAAEYLAKAAAMDGNQDAVAVAQAKALLAQGMLDSNEAIAMAASNMLARGM